jgi:hypothetical protein
VQPAQSVCDVPYGGAKICVRDQCNLTTPPRGERRTRVVRSIAASVPNPFDLVVILQARALPLGVHNVAVYRRAILEVISLGLGTERARLNYQFKHCSGGRSANLSWSYSRWRPFTLIPRALVAMKMRRT